MAKKKIIKKTYKKFDIKIEQVPNLNKIIFSTSTFFNSDELNDLFKHIKEIINRKMRGKYYFPQWTLLEENSGDFYNYDFANEIISAMSNNGFFNNYSNKTQVVTKKIEDKYFDVKEKKKIDDSEKNVYCTISDIGNLNNKTFLKVTLTKGYTNTDFNYPKI